MASTCVVVTCGRRLATAQTSFFTVLRPSPARTQSPPKSQSPLRCDMHILPGWRPHTDAGVPAASACPQLSPPGRQVQLLSRDPPGPAGEQVQRQKQWDLGPVPKEEEVGSSYTRESQAPLLPKDFLIQSSSQTLGPIRNSVLQMKGSPGSGGPCRSPTAGVRRGTAPCALLLRWHPSKGLRSGEGLGRWEN